jgi:signal transduction histidine kinase
MLGHDLRSPLSAVITSSQFMLDTGDLREPHHTLTTRIARSAKRMNQMVGDLLDFTRSRLGSGIPIERKPMDLSRAAYDAVAEMSAAHPDAVFRVDTSGDLRGEWDCARISQLLSNLLANAVQHGAKSPVAVTVKAADEHVDLRVHNRGTTIPAADMAGLFNPLKRIGSGQSSVAATPGGNLGLGLYIAERIVAAHGGSLSVASSDEAGTTFSVRLPR